MMRHLALPVLLLSLAACAGTSESEPTAPAEETGPASSAPAPAKGANATKRSTPELRRATCSLKGKEPAKVTLEETGRGGLVATFDGQPVPGRGTALYSVSAWDNAGEVGMQLGVKYLNGKQIGYFVFDFGTSQQKNLDGSPAVHGRTVRATFPRDALGGLAQKGVASWSAAFNINGKDVGTCPGGFDSLPFPG